MNTWVPATTARFTSRNLLSMTAGAAATGGAGPAVGQSRATPSPRIERVTVKRRGVGLRGHDPDRAFAGFTLFSPLPSDTGRST